MESLRVASRSLDQDPLPPLWVDAVALSLQSFYTGIERCFVLIVRAINGALPDGRQPRSARRAQGGHVSEPR